MYMLQALRRTAQIHGSKIGMVDGDGQRTWRETLDRVQSLAGSLERLGVRQGDRIAILALNSARYVEAYFAIFWLGAVCVPLNTRWAEEEIAYALEDTEPTILCVDSAFVAMAGKLRERCDSIQHLICMSRETSNNSLILDYESLIQSGGKTEPETVLGNSLAAICYTGGTTGRSKGVMHSHLNLWVSAITHGHDVLNLSTQDTVNLAVMPLFHIGGANPTFSTIVGGGRCIFLPSFQPEIFLKTLYDEKVTHTTLAPTMVRLVLDSLGNVGHPPFAMKVLTYGAAPMSQAQIEETMGKFPGMGLHQGYGQTEAAYIASLRVGDHEREGAGSSRLQSVGRAGSCSEVIVADPEGKELQRREIGELRVRGPHVMLGYWRKPVETAATIDNGWVKTGDACYMDEEGFIFLVDRLKDMIVSGAENIYSSEVENALATHPAIGTAVVIGVPDEKWGEAVHAIVVLRKGHAATAEDIISYCRKFIAGYKCPRSVEFRTDPMPVSAAGKILKRELRKPYWEGRASNLV